MSKAKHAVGVCLILTWAALPVPATADETTDGRLTDAERQEVVNLLEQSHADFEALVAGVSEDQWHVKPAPEKWSVGEVAEHLLLTEDMLYGIMQAALAAEPHADWQAVDAKGLNPILTTVPDRTQTFQAPERLQPTGQLDREDTLARFAAARAKTVELMHSDAPLKSHTQPNPLLGDANVRQWAAYCAAHNMRHNQQIDEVKKTLATTP